MTIDGFGGVSGRSAGTSLARGRLGPLRLTRRGMVMELSIDGTVEYSTLEARVAPAKIYRGCHYSRGLRRSIGSSCLCRCGWPSFSRDDAQLPPNQLDGASKASA